MVELKNLSSLHELKIDEIIDKDTGVHYLLCAHYGHHGNTLAITPMYNSDGTLKTDNY